MLHILNTRNFRYTPLPGNLWRLIPQDSYSRITLQTHFALEAWERMTQGGVKVKVQS